MGATNMTKTKRIERLEQQVVELLGEVAKLKIQVGLLEQTSFTIPATFPAGIPPVTWCDVTTDDTIPATTWSYSRPYPRPARCVNS